MTEYAHLPTNTVVTRLRDEINAATSLDCKSVTLSVSLVRAIADMLDRAVPEPEGALLEFLQEVAANGSRKHSISAHQLLMSYRSAPPPNSGHWYAGEDIDRLVREADEMLNGKGNAAPQAMLCDLMGQIQDAARDAERYRWLRDGDFTHKHERDHLSRNGWLLTDDELDSAIDAARAAQTKSDARCTAHHPSKQITCQLKEGHEGRHLVEYDGFVCQWASQETEGGL
jgi:hypothetical protein